jgi:hypothetical protein
MLHKILLVALFLSVSTLSAQEDLTSSCDGAYEACIVQCEEKERADEVNDCYTTCEASYSQCMGSVDVGSDIPVEVIDQDTPDTDRPAQE